MFISIVLVSARVVTVQHKLSHRKTALITIVFAANFTDNGIAPKIMVLFVDISSELVKIFQIELLKDKACSHY